MLICMEKRTDRSQKKHPTNHPVRKDRCAPQLQLRFNREMKSGQLKAIIARAVDFYGPGVTEKSAPGLLVFTNMRKGKKAQWSINPHVPRSYNYTPDAGKAL